LSVNLCSPEVVAGNLPTAEHHLTDVHGRPQALARGALPPPWKCRKVIFVLQMLSKFSVDGVFLHYFEKMLSAFGGFVPQTTVPLDPTGDFRPSDSLIAHSWKKSCGRLCWCLHTDWL